MRPTGSYLMHNVSPQRFDVGQPYFQCYQTECVARCRICWQNHLNKTNPTFKAWRKKRRMCDELSWMSMEAVASCVYYSNNWYRVSRKRRNTFVRRLEREYRAESYLKRYWNFIHVAKSLNSAAVHISGFEYFLGGNLFVIYVKIFQHTVYWIVLWVLLTMYLNMFFWPEEFNIFDCLFCAVYCMSMFSTWTHNKA
jgi:hypothetical protein